VTGACSRRRQLNVSAKSSRYRRHWRILFKSLNRTAKNSQLRQTYSIYAKDATSRPINFMVFRRFKKMIAFHQQVVHFPKMDLHDIHRSGNYYQNRVDFELEYPSMEAVHCYSWLEVVTFNSAGLIVSTSIPGSVLNG